MRKSKTQQTCSLHKGLSVKTPRNNRRPLQNKLNCKIHQKNNKLLKGYLKMQTTTGCKRLMKKSGVAVMIPRSLNMRIGRECSIRSISTTRLTINLEGKIKAIIIGTCSSKIIRLITTHTQIIRGSRGSATTTQQECPKEMSYHP